MRGLTTLMAVSALAVAMFAAGGNQGISAQHSHSHQGAGSPAGTAKSGGKGNADTSASSRAFAAVNSKMHRDMAIAYSGRADVDFVRGMIPHHQGAIDMARVVLEHGSDPDIRRLAQEIVKAQESEIAQMKSWLEKNGPK